MRYTVTAALPYTNGPIHIGHLAGVYIPADIFVRYLREKKHDVIYICGSDEHGVAISIKASKEGVTPKKIIEKYHHLIKDSFNAFGISFDNYARTSSKVHYETATSFFLDLYKKGLFEEIVTNQLYDPKTEQFLADRFVTGTCPKCQNPEAYGDQCEKCGRSINATDLIHPRSTISGYIPINKKTKHWFLRLDKSSDFLRNWVLNTHKNDWKSNVLGQVKSWLDEGLKPRAVTRDLDWGIPVPLEDAKGKVLYVWFDAPLGYISSTKEWAKKNKTDWAPYWKDENTKLIHFIGKDNIVFHCIIFPTILKTQGSYILPENVPANEFLNLEGQKISTSKNWAVWLHEYLSEFPDKQDVLRYVLTSIMPETKDSDFTWKDFQAKNNNELVAIFGNFFNRVTVLTHRYYKGIVPPSDALQPIDKSTLKILKSYPDKIGQSLESYRFKEACQELMNVARLGNKYLADQEPWKLLKEQPERAEAILYVGLQIASVLAVLSKPFLPFTSKKMIDILRLENTSWDDISEKELLVSGALIGETTLIFDKIEDDIINKQIDKLKSEHTHNLKDKSDDIFIQKENISFESFDKIDLRVGTIVAAEKMPKTDKLMIIKLDSGFDKRTIVSGLSQHYNPNDIIGKKVCFMANLEPRKFKGVESQGMILMTQTAKGELTFMTPEKSNVDNGKPVN